MDGQGFVCDFENLPTVRNRVRVNPHLAPSRSVFILHHIRFRRDRFSDTAFLAATAVSLASSLLSTGVAFAAESPIATARRGTLPSVLKGNPSSRPLPRLSTRRIPRSRRPPADNTPTPEPSNSRPRSTLDAHSRALRRPPRRGTPLFEPAAPVLGTGVTTHGEVTRRRSGSERSFRYPSLNGPAGGFYPDAGNTGSFCVDRCGRWQGSSPIAVWTS